MLRFFRLHADGSYYVGHTDDLEHRIALHESGEIRGYTSARRPVRLVWSADFATRNEAREREKQIKAGRAPRKRRLSGATGRRYSGSRDRGAVLRLRARSGRFAQDIRRNPDWGVRPYC